MDVRGRLGYLILSIAIAIVFVVGGNILFPTPPPMPASASTMTPPLSVPPSMTPAPQPRPDYKRVVPEAEGFKEIAPAMTNGALPLMVNLKTRQVLMSGAVSCSRGRLEYLIVGHGGKDYESLVRADVAPMNFNIALIGAGAAIPDSMDSRSFNEQARRSDVWPLFRIEVFHLDAKGDLVHRRAEEFVLNQQSDQPMKENLWVYTNSHTYVDPDSGSEIWVANFSKSLVGVFFEASCVIQNGDDNWNNDDLYVANPAICPPDGTGVLVLLALVREGKRQ